MKKRLNHIIAGFVALAGCLFISGCEQELDISEISTDNLLVLNSIINNMENPQVKLSNSVPVDGSKLPQYIQNGFVMLENENGKKDTLKYDFVQECYTANVAILPGKKYWIYARTSKLGNVSASTTMPGGSNGASATWKDSTSFDSFGFPQGTITLKINDNGAERNFYKVSLYFWNTTSAKWEVLEAVYRDEIINQNGYKTPEGALVFSDNKFNGTQKSVDFETPFGFTSQTPKFKVEVENLNQDAYNYFNSIRLYKNGSGALQEQTPIYSNIKNGIGIFAAGIKQVLVIN